MGGHYGSIQFRTDDRDRVRDAAEAVARERSIRCLVGRAKRGWVGVYPEGHGQDDGVGAALAARVGGHALHLLVHDDDVLAYWLYHDGALVDRYWSAPGYFGEAQRADEEPLVGDVDRFDFALDAANRVKLRALLRREDAPTFEGERLTRLGKLLGIADATAAYEYLNEPDTISPVKRRQFIEVPAAEVLSERARRAADRKRIADEWKRLVRSGGLLVRDERSGSSPKGVAAGEGFVVIWSDVMKKVAAVETHAPPWKTFAPADLALPGRVHVTDVDAAGGRLVIPIGDRVRIFDGGGGTWTQVAEIPEQDLTLSVSLSADGSRVGHASRNGAFVTEIATGRRLATTRPVQNHRVTVLSPDGRRLLVGGLTLRIVDADGVRSRELFVGGVAPGRQAALVQVLSSQLADVDADSMIARQLTLAEQLVAGGMFPADKLAAFREQLAKIADETRVRLNQVKNGTLPPEPRRAIEAVHAAGWTPDGRWLWCKTDAGLRVFDAAAIDALPDGGVPRPVWSTSLPDDGASHGVFAATTARDALIFAGRGRQLGRLDLSTGATRVLVELPAAATVTCLATSADGTTLGVATFDQSDGRHPYRSSWQAWNLAALLR